MVIQEDFASRLICSCSSVSGAAIVNCLPFADPDGDLAIARLFGVIDFLDIGLLLLLLLVLLLSLLAFSSFGESAFSVLLLMLSLLLASVIGSWMLRTSCYMLSFS